MQAFDREIHLLAEVQQRAVIVAPHAVADDAVAEVVRRDGLQVAKAFLANRVRRFLEDEELVLETRKSFVSQLLRTVEHAPEHGAGTDLLSLARELAKKEEHGLFPWQRAA